MPSFSRVTSAAEPLPAPLSLREMFSPAGNSLASADCADEQRFFGKASNLPNFGALVFRSAQPQRRLSVSYFKPPNRRPRT